MVTFIDILVVENYLERYKSFRSVSDFKKLINNSKHHSNSSSENDKIMSFNKEFVYDNLKFLSSNFLTEYKERLKEIELMQGNVELYHAQKADELIRYYELCEKHDFLNYDLKRLIVSQLDICLDGKEELIERKEILLGNKINFKFTKQIDVIVFFYLLHQNEVIKWSNSMPELNEIIKATSRYLNLDKNSYYDLEIKVKELYDIKNGHKTIEKSLSRLKNIFQKRDFFELKELQ